MTAPKWIGQIAVKTVLDDWDGLYAETERELMAAAPDSLTTRVTLDRIWDKLSQDARDNLIDVEEEQGGAL